MLLRWVVTLTVGFLTLRRGDTPLLLATQPVDLGGRFLAPVSGNFPIIPPPTPFFPVAPPSLLDKNGCVQPGKEAVVQEVATNFRDAVQNKNLQGIETAKQLVTSDFKVLSRFRFSQYKLTLLPYSFYVDNTAVAKHVLEHYVKAGIMPSRKEVEKEVEVLSPCDQQRVLGGFERAEAAWKQLMPVSFYNSHSPIKKPHAKKGYHRCYVADSEIVCHRLSF